MASGQLKLDCDKCFDDITLDITIQGRVLPTFKDIYSQVIEQGWYLGRNCYCPSCYAELPAHCDTCEYFDGNKVMGTSICLKDNKFALGSDYCPDHSPR